MIWKSNNLKTWINKPNITKHHHHHYHHHDQLQQPSLSLGLLKEPFPLIMISCLHPPVPYSDIPASSSTSSLQCLPLFLIHWLYKQYLSLVNLIHLLISMSLNLWKKCTVCDDYTFFFRCHFHILNHILFSVFSFQTTV